MTRVRVVSGFIYHAQAKFPGDEIDMPDTLAASKLAQGTVVLVVDEPAAAPPQPTTRDPQSHHRDPRPNARRG